jgi:ADP-ribose pyrophosphatase YjhB (NUDIX family)
MQPKICYTAAGILIHQDKVLLVKHKKLGIWLNPGGHIEAGEVPHQAAEREFFEETGVKVTAYDPQGSIKIENDDSEYIPTPILMNVHWVCPENFAARQKDPENYTLHPRWQKGCEQHLGFLYLLKPAGSLTYSEDKTETDGIGWFSLAEVQKLQTKENIRFEIQQAFNALKK